MDNTDWLEIEQLVRGAEGALLSGQLNEWQHADCTAFHVLATAILDLDDRLAAIEATTDQSVEDGEIPDEGMAYDE